MHIPMDIFTDSRNRSNTDRLQSWIYCHKCIALHGGTINGSVINLQLFTSNNLWTLTFKELYPQNNFLPFSGSFGTNVKNLQKMSLFDILGVQIDKQQNPYIKRLNKVSAINFTIAFIHRFKCRNNEIGFMTVIFVLHTKMYLWVVYWVISICLNSSKNYIGSLCKTRGIKWSINDLYIYKNKR